MNLVMIQHFDDGVRHSTYFDVYSLFRRYISNKNMKKMKSFSVLSSVVITVVDSNNSVIRDSVKAYRMLSCNSDTGMLSAIAGKVSVRN
jgi:uncharacterized membrane protein required for colicin V production